MKKRTLLAVVLVVSMGAVHAQQGTENNSLMQAWTKMSQMATSAGTTKSAYDNMVAQVSIAYEAVKKAIANINDPVARQDAVIKAKNAWQAIKDLVFGATTNATAQPANQSNFGTSSLDNAREMLQKEFSTNTSR
jgi:hypothetical protein